MITHRLTKEECRQYIQTHLFTPRKLPACSTDAAGIGHIGVELESFPYRKQGPDSVHQPVSLYHGDNSLTHTLLDISALHGGFNEKTDQAYQSSTIDSIDFPGGSRFLFEPGGQVEISTSPCSSLYDLETQLNNKQAILGSLAESTGIHFAQHGISPWWSADTLTNQLQKPRYGAMESYFNSIGPYGRQMMLLTGSLHINLDLGNSADVITKRIVAANLLAPFATAIFANSPSIAGKDSGHKSYRSYIWQHLDPKRTGLLKMPVPGEMPDMNTLIDLYLDLAMQAPLIYIPEISGETLPPHMTLAYWLDNDIAGIAPGIDHLANHLSLLFPEVRLKGYLEIRSIDAPPVKWQLVPVMFYTGLLYNDQCLDRTLDLLLPHSETIYEMWAHATYGLANDDIFAIAKQLMLLSAQGLSNMPSGFLQNNHVEQLVEFNTKFTQCRKTPADNLHVAT